MDLGLAGQGCVVTGGSRGIGLGIARLLAAEGAHVLLVARTREALEAATGECAAAATHGARVETLALDVTDDDAGERIVAACVGAFGAIHALVNNAGQTGVRDLEQLDEDDFRSLLELHVIAPLRAMRAVVPRMVEQGYGRIVNVCSAAGRMPTQTNPAYSVSKSAELALSRVFADRYAALDVLVNAVAPGPIETDMTTGSGGVMDQLAAAQGLTREQLLVNFKRRVPRARFGTYDEVAIAAVMLASPRCGFTSGSVWTVDGGFVPALY
jgi:3-oxoacyl-[acyl-carrier protein] reductase